MTAMEPTARLMQSAAKHEEAEADYCSARLANGRRATFLGRHLRRRHRYCADFQLILFSANALVYGCDRNAEHRRGETRVEGEQGK